MAVPRISRASTQLTDARVSFPFIFTSIVEPPERRDRLSTSLLSGTASE